MLVVVEKNGIESSRECKLDDDDGDLIVFWSEIMIRNVIVIVQRQRQSSDKFETNERLEMIERDYLQFSSHIIHFNR